MSFKDKMEEIKSKVEDNVAHIPWIDSVAEKTGLAKVYVVLGMIVGAAAFLFFGFGAGLLCNLVGFVYPAYMSFKAIESEDKADDTMWLTYWVVFAMFTILETFIDFILYWLPFYYAAKLGFLIWLFFPATQGAEFIYKNVLRPALKAHAHRVDGALNGAASLGGAVAAGAANVLSGAGAGAGAGAVDGKKTQ